MCHMIAGTQIALDCSTRGPNGNLFLCIITPTITVATYTARGISCHVTQKHIAFTPPWLLLDIQGCIHAGHILVSIYMCVYLFLIVSHKIFLLYTLYHQCELGYTKVDRLTVTQLNSMFYSGPEPTFSKSQSYTKTHKSQCHLAFSICRNSVLPK